MTSGDMTQAALEDRIFGLELALLNIGGALLAPGSWEDDQRLHQYMYDTVRRALLRTGFGDALDQREQQLFVRASAPNADELAHHTEPVAAAPQAVPPMPSAEEPHAASDSNSGPTDYGWPTRP